MAAVSGANTVVLTFRSIGTLTSDDDSVNFRYISSLTAPFSQITSRM